MALDLGPKKHTPTRRDEEIPTAILESDALRSNLEETAVSQVAQLPPKGRKPRSKGLVGAGSRAS